VALTIHAVDQGSAEWHALRCGVITASEVRLLMTPTLKPANNDKSRAHSYELLAQRITQYVEPHYISDDMLRGHEDESRARLLYAQRFAPVQEVGFATRAFASGLIIGYSPDGFVGSEGQIECKSRRQKYQVETVIGAANGIPEEYLLQVYTGLLVTGRAWCDYVSYSGGLPMAVIRVTADPAIQDAILTACEAVEAKLQALRSEYDSAIAARNWPATERTPADTVSITVGSM
jgi:hypothetical protein